MNYIKKLHLQALDENTIHHQEVPNDIDTIKSAQKSAEITEQIALEFLRYFQQTAELGFYSTGENYGKSHKEVFEEFLKTKQ